MQRARHHGVDFAALQTLRLVFENRSFSKAAELLAVNQSAVSYTVEKLRKAFDDPLFYRHGGQVVPTARCVAIAKEIAPLIERFDIIAQPAAFDPAEATVTIRIACNYYERLLILPQLMRRLRREAPGVRLETVNSFAHGREQLKRGDADLMIGPRRPDEPEFYIRHLVDERYVCVMDRANPLSRGDLTVDAYVRAPHVTVVYGGGWRSRYQVEMDAMGLELNQVVTTPSPSGVEEYLVGTDMISTVPERIAQRLGPEIAVVPSPVPAPFEIAMVWTTRTNDAADHRWLRKTLAEESATACAHRKVVADHSAPAARMVAGRAGE